MSAPLPQLLGLSGLCQQASFPPSVSQPEVMQSAGRFHHVIEVMVRPIAKRLHQNLTPFDAPNVVFDFNPDARNTVVVQLVNGGQRPVSGFLFRLLNGHPLRRKPLKPIVLPYRTAFGKCQLFLIGNRLVVLLSFVGVTEITHFASPVMDDQVFDGMGLALATVVGFAVSFVFGAIDPTFSTIDDEF